MADIPSSLVKLNDIEVDANSPNTEALFNKIGANINGLIDDKSAQESRLNQLESANIHFGPLENRTFTTGTIQEILATLNVTTNLSTTVRVGLTSGSHTPAPTFTYTLSASGNSRLNLSDGTTNFLTAPFQNNVTSYTADSRITGFNFIYTGMTPGVAKTLEFSLVGTNNIISGQIKDFRLFVEEIL